MASTTYRILPDAGEWMLLREGAHRAESRHAGRTAAVARGRELCRRNLPSRLLVHGKDGAVELEYSFDTLAPEGAD